MTRLTLLIITGMIGVIGGGGIIAGTIAIRHASAERQRARAVERLTAADVERIATRIFRIESPTNAELVERIRGALRACASDPRCSRAFRATVKSASSSGAGSTQPATVRPAAAHRRAARPRPRPVPDRHRPRRLGGGGTTQPAPAPSKPPPAGDIHTPQGLPGPQLCTPLVGVNC